MSRPKVLVVHTGGTLGMPESRPGDVLRPSEVKGQLLEPLSFLSRLADVEWDVLVNLDSSDITPEHWRRLARLIDSRREDVEGIVIVHGTDTLAWTATALGLMIAGPTLPIVLTGSQRPLSALRTDAPRNLLNAVEVAISGRPGVHVVFGDTVLPGVATTKDSIFRFDAFRAPNAPTLARIGLDITWRDFPLRRRKYWCDTRLEPNVALIPLIPGVPPDMAQRLIEGGTRALVLEAFGAGNIPLGDVSWAPALEGARESRVPVVISTQCRHGRVDASLYAGARQAHELGASFATGMTREAALIKTMILLGRKTSYGRFRREFEKDWCGETGRLGIAR